MSDRIHRRLLAGTLVPALLLASLLLAGCEATGPTTRLDAEDERLPEEWGVVAVQVVSNTYRLAPMLWNWSAILAVDLEDTEIQHALERSGSGLDRSSVFVGALPPGEYRFFGLYAIQRYPDATYSLSAPVPLSLGSFRVDDDRITNLGTLVYQPLGESLPSSSEIEDQPYLVVRFNDDEDLRPFVAEAFPERYDALDHSAYLGWLGEPVNGVSEDVATSFRAMAVPSSFVPVEDGVAAPARMGQVFFRSSGSDDWVRSDTGETVQMLDVSRTAHGWLASGERGVLVEAATLDGPWRRVEGPSLQKALIWIHETADGTRYALGRGGEPWVNLYRQPSGGRWASIRSFTRTTPSPIVRDDDTLLVFHDKSRHTFDMKTGDLVETATMKGKRPDYGIFKQPDGTLVTSPSFGVISSPRSDFSRDWGDDWTRTRHAGSEETRTGGMSDVSVILSDGSELAVVRRGHIDPYSKRVEYEDVPRLRRLPPDSRDPVWLGEMAPECTRLEPRLSTDDAIYVSCLDGRLKLSTDGGRTWELIYIPGETDEVDEVETEGLI